MKAKYSKKLKTELLYHKEEFILLFYFDRIKVLQLSFNRKIEVSRYCKAHKISIDKDSSIKY